MCPPEKSIPTPWKVIRNSWGGGVLREAKYEAKLEFLGGRGCILYYNVHVTIQQTILKKKTTNIAGFKIAAGTLATLAGDFSSKK